MCVFSICLLRRRQLDDDGDEDDARKGQNTKQKAMIKKIRTKQRLMI